MGPWRVRFVDYADQSMRRYDPPPIDADGVWLAYIDRSHKTPMIYFACPICTTFGTVLLDQPSGHTWNGDANAPTLSPSLVTGCGFHGWVSDGNVTDAGSKAH